MVIPEIQEWCMYSSSSAVAFAREDVIGEGEQSSNILLDCTTSNTKKEAQMNMISRRVHSQKMLPGGNHHDSKVGTF